jgi:hypothetical protein
MINFDQSIKTIWFGFFNLNRCFRILFASLNFTSKIRSNFWGKKCRVSNTHQIKGWAINKLSSPAASFRLSILFVCIVWLPLSTLASCGESHRLSREFFFHFLSSHVMHIVFQLTNDFHFFSKHDVDFFYSCNCYKIQFYLTFDCHMSDSNERAN